MKNIENNLQLEQLDKKFKAFRKLNKLTPPKGWVFATRTTLGMSLGQLGKRMGVSAQAVKGLEQREKNGSISLKNLDEAAKAFGLRLTYGFYSPDKSLKKIIDDRAYKMAEQIVARTHKTMQLENQANSKARLKRAIKERAKEIVDKNTKSLWN